MRGCPFKQIKMKYQILLQHEKREGQWKDGEISQHKNKQKNHIIHIEALNIDYKT